MIEKVSQRKPRATSNRRTTSCGYSRGDDTRARVIASALKLFGRHGFDGASTRDIALDAGVNAPALQYYFASKEGLYLACVEEMSARFWAAIGPASARAEALLAERAAHTELIDALCTMQERMADFILCPAEPAEWLLIVVREHAGFGPDAGFKLMYQQVSAKLFAINAAIVGRLLGRRADAEETRLRAATLNGHLMMFLYSRRTLLESLGWTRVRVEHVGAIKRMIRENSEATLHAMLEARKGRKARTARPARAKRNARKVRAERVDSQPIS